MYQENPLINLITEQVKYLYGWYKEGDEPGKTKKKKINKYDEIEIALDSNDPLHKHLDSICKKINGDKKKDPADKVGKSDLHVSMITKVKDNFTKKFDHYIMRIYGGLNGPGEWDNYCRDFAKFFLMLRNDNIIDHACMCQLDNDCADDVFTAYVSFRLKKDVNKNGG